MLHGHLFDLRIVKKEGKKLDVYNVLEEEITWRWKMKKAKIAPIIVGGRLWGQY